MRRPVRDRTDDLAWGLHLIDVDQSMGALIDTVRLQGEACQAAADAPRR